MTKSLQSLKVQSRLTIYTGRDVGDGSFGKGVALLLQGVAELGSLNKAAKSIHMAYSKAWRIVKEAEEAFGLKLTIREGARGSFLTESGEKLLTVYYQLEQEATAFLNKRFAELCAED